MKLRELIRSVADANPSADPSEIVTLVVEQTPDNLVREYFRNAVRGAVLEVLRSDRNADLIESTSSGRPVRRIPNRSSKVDGIRSAWQNFLADRVLGADGYKLVGDCTLADVDFIIKARESLIADVEAINARWKGLRERMIETVAARIRDLPEPKAAA